MGYRVAHGIAKLLVPYHRWVFTLWTAFLGISGSLVATAPRSLGNFALLAASMVGMLVGEKLAQIDSQARTVSFHAKADLDSVRIEATMENSVWRLVIGIGFAILCGAMGLANVDNTP